TKTLQHTFCTHKQYFIILKFCQFMKEQQTELLEGLGNTCLLNQTVTLDLTLSQEEQWKMYSTSLRRQLRRIADKGIKCEVASSTTEWLTFAELYDASMKRRNANPHYFFPPTYFLHLRKACAFETLLLVSRYRGEIIAGGVFTMCNGTMQYHLGAVKSDYVTFSPLKQIVDEARRIGYSKGMRIFHLGGGYGGEENSLFAFKSRFSPLRKEFRVWKYCTNEEAYAQLIEAEKGAQNKADKETENGTEHGTETFTERSYFPLYRFI
ncbi:MAG: GNAT family N-acetyltransferase, partial [Bacteroidales bacterium]|nr:GNAT family N-acetyltransferase [Bacteroidales bacterium]